MLDTVIYVMAISLQVSGAILLLLWSFGNTKKKMYEEILNKESPAILDGRSIKDIDISDGLRNVYLNRVAFACLAIGYITGIFWDIGKTPKAYVALCVIGVTFILTVILFIVCGEIANIRQEVYKDKYINDTGNRIM